MMILDKVELKNNLKERFEDLTDKADLCAHEILSAKNDISEIIDNHIYFTKELVDSIVDFHTVFEQFKDNYAKNPESWIFKEIKKVGASLDSIINYIEKFSKY